MNDGSVDKSGSEIEIQYLEIVLSVKYAYRSPMSGRCGTCCGPVSLHHSGYARWNSAKSPANQTNLIKFRLKSVH